MAKAAVIMGGMSEKIAEWIKECDYTSDVAPNIDVFLNTALRKSDTYARILLLSRALNEQAVADLKEYCKSRSSETVVVFFGQRGKEDEAVRRYLQIYSSTTACSMMLEGKFSKELALSAVTMSAAAITERYGIKDIFNVEVARSSYAMPEPEVQQPQQAQQEQAQPQEKRSVFGALFGGKKKGKKGNAPADNIQNVQQPVNNQQNMQQGYPQNQQMGYPQGQPMSQPMGGQQGFQQAQSTGQTMGQQGFSQGQPIQATQSQYDANVMAGSNNVMNNQVNPPESHHQTGGFNDYNGFGGSDGVPVGSFDNQQPMGNFNEPQPQVESSQPMGGFDNAQSPVQGSQSMGGFGAFTPGQVNLGGQDTAPLDMGFSEPSGEQSIPETPTAPVDYVSPAGDPEPQPQQGFGINQGSSFDVPQQDFGASQSIGFNVPQQDFSTSQASSPSTPQSDFGMNQDSGFSVPQQDFGANQGGFGQQPVADYTAPQQQTQPVNSMGYTGQEQAPQLQQQNNDFYSQNPYGQQTYQQPSITPSTQPAFQQGQTGYQDWQNQSMQVGSQLNNQGFGGNNQGFGQSSQSMYEQNVNVDTSNWSLPNGQAQQAQNSQWPEPSQVQDTVVEMDFSAVAFEQQMQQPAVPSSQVVVDDSLSALAGVGLEDNKVRQRETAGGKTRVITKTVVKNVSNSGDLIKGMSSGTTRKILVVTGDRGTGVTSTAFTLAMQLAKKVEVLYFDCDVENHGLLNYIDYNKFCGFEDICRNGISLCRSSKAFDSCVTLWDDGLSILTSDFSCDVKTDMLSMVGGIVAERCLDYGLTVVDCPIKFLPCINELLLSANVALCVEGSKRGFMNMLCQLESSPLEMRYKRRMCSSSTMLLTKCVQNTDLKKLVNYIISIYEPDGADWMAINKVAFNGKWTDKMIAAVLS